MARKRTLSLSFEIEEGEDVLLVAMCSTGPTLSVAMRTPKETFGKILSKLPPSTKAITAKYGNWVDVPDQPKPGPNEFEDL